MSERAFMFCPICRATNGQKVEMYRDAHLFTCLMSHAIQQEQLMAMNPEMIKLEFHFKPQPNDVKVECWVNSEVLRRAKEILGDRFHPTVDSLLRVVVTGDYVIVDGVQAKQLRDKNIKNGQEMVACALDNDRLDAENLDLKNKVAYFEGIFKRASEEIEVPQ